MYTYNERDFSHKPFKNYLEHAFKTITVLNVIYFFKVIVIIWIANEWTQCQILVSWRTTYHILDVARDKTNIVLQFKDNVKAKTIETVTHIVFVV